MTSNLPPRLTADWVQQSRFPLYNSTHMHVWRTRSSDISYTETPTLGRKKSIKGPRNPLIIQMRMLEFDNTVDVQVCLVMILSIND